MDCIREAPGGCQVAQVAAKWRVLIRLTVFGASDGEDKGAYAIQGIEPRLRIA